MSIINPPSNNKYINMYKKIKGTDTPLRFPCLYIESVRKKLIFEFLLNMIVN
jgi:hypothetical protein